MNRTNGSVVFASGSPYKNVEFEGKVYEPGQGNNMYIFPGIGMGAILSKARHVTDSMVEQAAIALASSLTDDEKSSGLVYPRLTRIRDISAQIALAVIRAAQKDVSDSSKLFNKECLIIFRLEPRWEWAFPQPFWRCRPWLYQSKTMATYQHSYLPSFVKFTESMYMYASMHLLLLLRKDCYVKIDQVRYHFATDRH